MEGAHYWSCSSCLQLGMVKLRFKREGFPPCTLARPVKEISMFRACYFSNVGAMRPNVACYEFIREWGSNHGDRHIS